MQLLVSTKISQGTRKNDFSNATEGEIVDFPSHECTGEAIDGRCGCKRSLVGINSRLATTTVIVAELPLTKEELIEQIKDSLEQALPGLGSEEAPLIAQDLIHYGKAFPVGTVIERRGRNLSERALSNATA